MKAKAVKRRKSYSDALILQDFDIKGLHLLSPKMVVGVRISTIYCQFAKYGNNPSRENEITILLNALHSVRNDRYRRYRYVPMTLQDVISCFGRDLKKLPISSFVQGDLIERTPLNV